MSVFMNLTQEDGTPVLVNGDFVQRVETAGTHAGSILIFSDTPRHRLVVKDSFDTVRALLDARKGPRV